MRTLRVEPLPNSTRAPCGPVKFAISAESAGRVWRLERGGGRLGALRYFAQTPAGPLPRKAIRAKAGGPARQNTKGGRTTPKIRPQGEAEGDRPLVGVCWLPNPSPA